MANSHAQEWKKSLQKLYDAVEKDLQEVRKQKAEVQRMRLEVEQMLSGQFIRDNGRIVISAPEIIIGNVDFDGTLKGDAPFSHVVIRSNKIDIEGSSPAGTTSGGSITQRASIIKSLAVDPGPEGLESVVSDSSSIICQARSISLNSNDGKEVFTQSPALPMTGIALNSDTTVSINATPSVERKIEYINNVKNALSSQKSNLKTAISSKKKFVDKLLDDIDENIKSQEQYTADEITCAISIQDIQEANDKLRVLKRALPSASAECVGLMAQLAEVNRQSKALDKAKSNLNSAKGNFKTKTTAANVSINSEAVNITSIDGDGNLRTNDGAAINLQAQSINLTSHDNNGALLEKGKVKINSKTIDVSTADFKGKDEKNWENPAVGDINVVSKNIKVESVDYATKDKKPEIKALTQGGKLFMRVESVDILAADKEGKATGSVTMNAKSVEIKSMDVDKEKLTDKELAAGSTMVLVSEKMWQGSKDQKVKSKQMQVASEKVAIIAKTTAEMQQDKATIQLDGGNFSAGGGKSELFGDTSINGKTDIKGDLKAPKATIDNVEAKSSFKSTNISDGIAVPGAPSSAKLSAKLKEEDAPKKQ